jgi:hypothetical protein
MTWRWGRWRLLGGALTLCSWLLLVTHICVDVGQTHATVAASHVHSEADPHDADSPLHSQCLFALWASLGRVPVDPAIVADAWVVPGVPALPAPSILEQPRWSPLVRPVVARSAPLYLLHATLLI